MPPGPSAPCDLETGADKLQRLHALWQQYGDCVRVPAASRAAATWLVTDPALIRRILVSNHRNYVKGVGIERVRVLLGDGLMAGEGAHWRGQRRLLQPAFQQAALGAYLRGFHTQALALSARWQQAARAGERVNVTAEVSTSTLTAVLQALFSEDLDDLRDAAGQPAFALVSEQSQRDLQFAVRFRALGAQIRELAARRRRERRFPPDLLSHCLRARRGASGPMDDKALVDEVLTLIVAGHETTAASLNWVWYLLATHPQVCARLRVDLRDLDLDTVPGREQLARWQPVARIVKEALRLYPPGWLYTRRAVHDDTLGGYHLPAGSDVFICSWLLHRHPDHWDAPEAFRPERFTAEAEAGRARYSYLPFSAGPRHCIGEGFAMAEMLIHVAQVARHLRPLAPTDAAPALEAEVNLRPRAPLWLRFEVCDD